MKCKYGVLDGVSYSESYNDGSMKNCILQSKNTLNTEYGPLIPQYNDDSERRKLKSSLEFYKNGNMKKVYLQEKIYLGTEAGIIPAETIMFYENGMIKKIFPLDGKLTGFWTQYHEYGLAEELEIKTSAGIVKNKIISISFYKNSKIKAITLWPQEKMKLNTPAGEVEVRTGVSFYENGMIKSVEPASKFKVKTPIGTLTAYDVSPLGIHGDNNSLSFHEDGRVKSLYTSSEEIIVEDGKMEYVYSPVEKISMCSDEKKDLVPLKVEFGSGEVHLEGGNEKYDLEKFSFKVGKYKSNPEKHAILCS